MSHLRVALVGLFLGLGLASSAHALQIERVSSPIHYVDNTNGSTYRGLYAAYRITNNEATAYADTFVTLSGFASNANIKLAQHEDGIQHLGPLAPGQQKTAYFYLYAATDALVAESHTVSVYGARPPGTALATASFTLTTTESITAQANKVTTRDYLPANPVIGGTVVMTIEGDTGTVGSDGNFAYSPASAIDWPADVFELVDARVLLKNAQGVFVEVAGTKGTLFTTKAPGATSPPVSGTYRCEFTLRVAKSSPTATAVAPIVHIRSGQQMKHNDPAAVGLTPIPPATNNDVILSRAPSLVLDPLGHEVTHTITITNHGTLDVVFDEIVDDLANSAAMPTVKPGSVTYDGVPVALTPTIVGTELHFVWFYDMLAGATHTLSYTLVYPAVDGGYLHAAYGLFSASGTGIAYVDTTALATDFEPAVAKVYIGVVALDLNDDHDGAVEATPLTLDVAVHLFANDFGVNPATFSLPSTTTSAGGTVTYDAATGAVTYTSAAGVTTDSFTYRACSFISNTDCQTATVTLDVNRHPVVADAKVVVALGETPVVFDVASVYTDPDGDLLASGSVTSTSAGQASWDANHLRFTPPAAAGTSTIAYTACDEGVPTACDAAVLTVVVNDPPVLAPVATTAAWGDLVTTTFASLFVSTGVVEGDDPSDGDTDGIASMLVASSADGPFATTASLADGGSCATDDWIPGLGSVALSVGGASGDVTCWVQICEEVPTGDVRVCSVTSITVTAVECLESNDCGVGEVCDPASHACVPCRDTATYPATDDGCDTAEPICEGSGDGATCVACQDDHATGQDLGCSVTTPACVTGGDGQRRCVGCESDGDCGAGLVCDLDAQVCIGCLDTASYPTADHGCEALPGRAVCDTERAADACVRCIDSVATGRDEGCSADTPICDAQAGAYGTCYQCLVDADCGSGAVCDPTSHACVACNDDRATGVDHGCTTGAPECITTSGGGRQCVACDDDSDCGAGEVCDVAAHVCAGCLDSAAFPGIDHGCEPVAGQGRAVCDAGSGEAGETCVHCVDSAASGRDEGCGAEAPICDPTEGTYGVCHQCLEDLDCAADELCDDGRCVPRNHPPIARDDLATTPEDTGVLVVVKANDVDPDGDALDVTRVTAAPIHGTATVGADDTILYVPAADFHGDDVLRYELCDAHALCVVATVFITIAPTNDPPQAGADGATTKAVTPVTIAVADNDSDVDGDPLTVERIVFPPQNGAAVVEDDGRVTYTPRMGFGGYDVFSYEICDPSGLCATGNVTVHVGVDDQAPVAVDDAAATATGAPVSVSVLANDSDPDGDPLTLARVTRPAHGTANVEGDTVRYVPEPGFAGVDTFTYTVCDDLGACATASVSVTVTAAANRPPVAADDLASTTVGRAVTLAVTDNDLDPDGDALVVSAVATEPAHGTVTSDGGTITYTPSPGFVGTDELEIVVSDGHGGTDTSRVTIVVAPTDNVAPDAVDDRFDVPQSGATPLDVTANDTDGNDDALVVVDVVQPSQGVVTIGADGRLVYTPKPGAHGTDTFTYTVSDGRGGTDTATVTVVFPVGNEPPLAVGDSVVTPEDQAVLVVVLANDSDPDGDALTVTGIAVPPRHGDAVVRADGTILYTPDPDYSQNGDLPGTDAFRYTVCDAQGACSEASVAVLVTPLNDPPRAQDDSYGIPNDEASILDPTLNDGDPDLDVLVISRVVTAPEHGAAFVNPDATVTYEPTSGYVGADSFVYEVCDPSGACDTATVVLSVGEGNLTPTPDDDEASALEAGSVVIDVLDNDSDPDGDELHIGRVEDPTHGTVSVEDGAIVYEPDPDFIGVDVFYYEACDADGACGVAFVVVHVTAAVNTPPVAVDDTVATPQNTPIVIDTLANDFDADGDALTTTRVTQPSHGAVLRNDDGTVTYAPELDFLGEDAFTVSIEDGHGGTATQVVYVHVIGLDNDPPDAQDDAYDVPSDRSTALSVMANDSDPDGDPLTIVAVVQAVHATVSIGADGTLTVTPDGVYIGPDRFSYTVTDDNGGYDTAWVDLVIGDRDHDGLGDGHEANDLGTDPDDFDSDDDGLGDGAEIGGGDPQAYEPGVDTNPLDADTDDDGLKDGDELDGAGPLADVGATDPLDPDTDGDGVADGVEVGVTTPVPGGTSAVGEVPFAGTDLTKWSPDADPTTTTNPLDDDTDDDGLLDGTEDADHNGRWDGTVGGTGTPGEGETDPLERDTDGDGILDGTELGLVEPEGQDTERAFFVPDLDPATTTDPLDTDTDDGGVPDGAEDGNHNGWQDPGEIDPNVGSDDAVPEYIAEGGGGGCAGGGEEAALGLIAALGLVASRARRGLGLSRARR